MGAIPVVRFPIFRAVRVIGVIVAALVLIWTIRFRGGLALISDNKDLIFNVRFFPILFFFQFLFLKVLILIFHILSLYLLGIHFEPYFLGKWLMGYLAHFFWVLVISLNLF